MDPLRQLVTAVLALPVVACAAVGPQQPADAKPADAPAAQAGEGTRGRRLDGNCRLGQSCCSMAWIRAGASGSTVLP